MHGTDPGAAASTRQGVDASPSGDTSRPQGRYKASYTMTDEYYDRFFAAAKQSGCTTTEAAIRVAEMYLDGKPRRFGKRRVKQAERDEAFFTWRTLTELPGHSWQDDSLVLALAHYVRQERIAAPGLLAHVAKVAPDEAKRAVRLSGLVLKPASPRRPEVAQLAQVAPNEFTVFGQTLEAFFNAHRDRRDLVARHREPFAELALIEVMAYASLYAFKHLIAEGAEADALRMQNVWGAVTRLLQRVLRGRSATIRRSGCRRPRRDALRRRLFLRRLRPCDRVGKRLGTIAREIARTGHRVTVRLARSRSCAFRSSHHHVSGNPGRYLPTTAGRERRSQ